MNIVTVIERLIDAAPCTQHILTNCCSAELTGNRLVIGMPDVPLLRADFEQHAGELERDLEFFFGLALEHSFSPLALPFLPHPAQGGKHGNYLLFLFPDGDSFSYSIVKKSELWTAVQEKRTPVLFDQGTTGLPYTNISLFAFLEKSFTSLHEHLKTTWTYLHPIIPFESCDRLLLDRLLFDGVLKQLEKNSIRDIRRFVGIPCFTPVDYLVVFGGKS